MANRLLVVCTLLPFSLGVRLCCSAPGDRCFVEARGQRQPLPPNLISRVIQSLEETLGQSARVAGCARGFSLDGDTKHGIPQHRVSAEQAELLRPAQP